MCEHSLTCDECNERLINERKAYESGTFSLVGGSIWGGGYPFIYDTGLTYREAKDKARQRNSLNTDIVYTVEREK